MKPFISGFNLIELLITLAIIAIIALISYPSYLHLVNKTYTQQAKTVLYDLATKLEQYYLKQNSYKNITIQQLNPVPNLNKHYDFTLTTATNHSYLLTAKSKNKHNHHYHLTLDHLGNFKGADL